jgi:hypothetical protein
VEFFAEIKNTDLNKKSLQKLLSIKQLPQLCCSIDSVILDNIDSGIIYCVWGQFKIHREELDYGVRFSLPHCPNALAWTIAIDQDTEDLVIHCTINKKQHDEEFVASIEQFVLDFKSGIKKAGENHQ